MFRRIAALTKDGPTKVVSTHPLELIGLLELGWHVQIDVRTAPLGHPDNRSDVPAIPIPLISRPSPQPGTPPLPPAMAFTDRLALALSENIGLREIRWDHLIYAYMIENTRIYEIFRRVVKEFLFGEKLGTPSAATQLWLRNTEELFYRDPPPLSITNISSHIRPDLRATRRNAY